MKVEMNRNVCWNFSYNGTIQNRDSLFLMPCNDLKNEHSFTLITGEMPSGTEWRIHL